MEHRKNQKRVAPFELYADDPERADRIVFGREPHKDRRGFLKRAGLAAMGAAVGARISLADADRVTGRRRWGDRDRLECRQPGRRETLSLRGSLGVERTLSGDETAVGVSGTKLTSKAPDNKVLLGAGASWHRDGFTLGAEVRASGVGSKDRDLGGHLSLGITF